ncbi:helix-turn-helix domain-containing protein [Candidatus Woesearchaeota archaeon]|nr:helix-turn-helix domain-containing protein [Candidatus Woesearchaeota archaeon]
MCDQKNILVEIYDELCSYENLETAFNRARRGKTLKKYVIDFEENLKDNLMKLRSELLTHEYQPKPLKTFILRDPKTRKISKSAFRDRVIHHAICNLIESVFDKRFIQDSFANRLGKGTLNAIKRFDVFKRKVSKNNTIRCYVLKADIKSYFDTVNHDILIKLLSKRIHDGRLMWLIRTILGNHQGKESNKGMPLGNLTSQFFANVYLNELDQYVKHKLRAKYYIRYVDDFVILHQSKTVLEEYKKKIISFLGDKLDLKLHPGKSQIIKLEKGIGFLGFRIFYHHKILVKKNMRKFENKMEQMKKDYRLEKIEREKVIEKYEGWIAYASHANTYKYRKRMTSKLNHAFPAQPEVKVTSVKKHENFHKKVDLSKIEFSQQKTLQLINKGLNVKQIAKERNIKEGTVWNHIANSVQHHQLPLKRVMETYKVRKILNAITSPENKLKEIKNRIKDDSISYNEIQVVLANVKGKHKKKSISYYVEWYQRTNCFRKCYYNKNQRNECRVKFQQLVAKGLNMEFSKHDFLDFFHNHVNICTLPDKDKKKFLSWGEFKQSLKKKKH